MEAFVQETLARLVGKPGAAWNDLDALLVMIEIKSQETHLILDAEALFGLEHPTFGLERLRERLAADEQAVAEPGQPNRLRIRLPRPLRFRGGRSWRDGDTDTGSTRVARPDPHLVDGLRKAHLILAEQGIELSSRRFALNAQAPPQSYQRKLCLLALLAPQLQQSILEGRTFRNITLGPARPRPAAAALARAVGLAGGAIYIERVCLMPVGRVARRSRRVQFP